MTTGPGVAGTSPNYPADWAHNKKKKNRRPLTRRFIEINGKFKKQEKCTPIAYRKKALKIV